MQIGELFILGFFGKTIPAWLRQFADRYGLGGVILFDYSCQTQQHDNNIEIAGAGAAALRRDCVAAVQSDGVHRSGRRIGTAAEGRPRLCAAAECEGIQSSRGGSKAPNPDRELCRDAAARHSLRFRAGDRRRLQSRQSEYRQSEALLLRRHRRSRGQRAIGQRGRARATDRPVPEAFSRHRRRGGGFAPGVHGHLGLR